MREGPSSPDNSLGTLAIGQVDGRLIMREDGRTWKRDPSNAIVSCPRG